MWLASSYVFLFCILLVDFPFVVTEQLWQLLDHIFHNRSRGKEVISFPSNCSNSLGIESGRLEQPGLLKCASQEQYWLPGGCSVPSGSGLLYIHKPSFPSSGLGQLQPNNIEREQGRNEFPKKTGLLLESEYPEAEPRSCKCPWQKGRWPGEPGALLLWLVCILQWPGRTGLCRWVLHNHQILSYSALLARGPHWSAESLCGDKSEGKMGLRWSKVSRRLGAHLLVSKSVTIAIKEEGPYGFIFLSAVTVCLWGQRCWLLRLANLPLFAFMR